MQALYLQALSPVAETTGDTSSTDFDPKRSTADAVAKCFILLSRKRSAKRVLQAIFARASTGLTLSLAVGRVS